MKKCKLCNLHQKILVDCLSYNNGTMQLSGKVNNILIIRDEEREFLFTIKVCPICGKPLK